MKNLLFYIGWVIGGIVLAVIGGNLWWSLWMNHGWPGSPGVLVDLLKADGEGAYDATLFEMILIVALALGSLTFGHIIWVRNRDSMPRPSQTLPQ